MAPLGSTVVGDAVGVGVAQDAEVGRAEGLHAPVRGLGDLARRLDLVVQHHQHAAAPAAGRSRGAHAVQEVDRGIGRNARGRALRADHHHRERHLEHEVEEIRRLLERGRAVADHDAGEVGVLGRQLGAQRRQRVPFGEVDVGAGGVAEVDRDHLGRFVDLGKARHDRARMQAVVVHAIVLQFERMDAQRGDGASRSDEGDLGLGNDNHD